MDRRNCPVCHTSIRTFQRLCTHIIQYHDGKMGEITCNINNCQQTYTNVHTWKSHVRRTACHRAATGMGRRSLINPIAPTNENPPMDDSESDTADNIPQQGPTPQELYEDFRSRYQQTFFDFTVKMKEKYMLPNSVADRLTDDVQHLLESFQQNIYEIIKKTVSCQQRSPHIKFYL